MDSIRLKTKELQSKMYLTQTHWLIKVINSERSELGQLSEWRELGEWSESCEVNRISRMSLAQGTAREVVLKEISGHYMCHTWRNFAWHSKLEEA